MEQIYYGIAIVVYGTFIIRFILSWIGGDFDVDMDVDTDLDLGDVVSFKGATHFLMGMFGWLSVKGFITHNIQWYDYLIGFILGIIFVVILFYIYKFMMKLESKPTILFGEDLIGHQGTVYLKEYEDLDTGWKHYTITVNNGNGTVELSAISTKSFRTGDSITIFDFENSYYLIK
jgi:hypothetical protein